MADDENPLIKALPPVSDYLTYLTIVDYNLTLENLPVLHRVLQDETLTTNIGWDLVHILVPHLPESDECLQDIARLGNPREVILKVTESLRLIEYDMDDGGDDDIDLESEDVRAKAESSTYPLKTAPTQDGTGGQVIETPPPLPLPVDQFISLLSMLNVLHKRIKTKYPSRFLSTTLQAILASFSSASRYREEMILAIVKFVRAVTGNQRPVLPTRKSSGVLRTGVPSKTLQPATDPEASISTESSSEERAMQERLLQAFITHILEEYLLNLPAYDDVPGMAWCSRIMEKTYPGRIIPNTDTFAHRFANEQRLQQRIDAVGQLVNLAHDLKLNDEQLLSAAITIEKFQEVDKDEDDPPASADEIPLSRLGSLLLYSGRQVSTILYERERRAGPPFAIFPDHQELFKHCLSSHEMGTGQLGTEPEALIDSILALGLVCLERDAVGEPATEEQFNSYLQTAALLSSNCPNANLRGHAHYLTSTILRSQPDENVRLAFIRDTLEHCPFENLKVSAVGWIKGETIEANPPSLDPVSTSLAQGSSGDEKSIFANSLPLDSLAPFLFPSLQADLITAPIKEAWMTFQTNVSFYLASLNFLYLLLCAKHLHQNLEILELWNNADIAGSFLQPLRDAKARLSVELQNGELVGDRTEAIDAELVLLGETIERVTRAATVLQTA